MSIADGGEYGVPPEGDGDLFVELLDFGVVIVVFGFFELLLAEFEFAFLDEGHAAWVMPEREQGLYLAWKTLASREWSLCGIPDSRRKIAQLPEFPEDTLLDCLDALGVPAVPRREGWKDELRVFCRETLARAESVLVVALRGVR